MSIGFSIYSWGLRNLLKNDGFVNDVHEGVEVVRDISYGPREEQLLDVYVPKGSEGELPLLVNVHGGGWISGQKERFCGYCSSMAARGFVVVNFYYRLAPENKWPAMFEDVCAAFGWALEHAHEYGADPAKLLAVGESAGGQLLALYCCCCTDPELAAINGVMPPEGGLPHAVGLNSGSMAPNETFGFRTFLGDMFQKGGTKEEIEAFSPILHVNENFPPAHIVTAKQDFLRKDSELMAQRLAELGVPYEFTMKEREDGSLGHTFHLNERLPIAVITNDEQAAFLHKYV